MMTMEVWKREGDGVHEHDNDEQQDMVYFAAAGPCSLETEAGIVDADVFIAVEEELLKMRREIW